LAMNLTVAEIADRIKRPNESRLAARDRLRNWTKEDVIFCQNKHPGTGRARIYDPDELKRAEIVEMMSRLGLQVIGDKHRMLATKIMRDPQLKADLANLLAALES
jgi:hypothetical protein